MPKEELRRLPDVVTAHLLRALLTIPRRPDARLVLKPVEERRPPFWTTENDYNVMFRGRRVGRIDLNPRPEPYDVHAPWRWFLDYGIDGASELADPKRRMVSGRAATRGEAMQAFRRAFDEVLFGPSQASGT